MTRKKLEEIFDSHDDEFLKFDRITVKRSQRPDLHAFLLLDELVPGTGDMVCSSEHDEIFLDTDPDELAKVASKENIIDLIRCGVRFGEYDSLCMFT